MHRREFIANAALAVGCAAIPLVPAAAGTEEVETEVGPNGERFEWVHGVSEVGQTYGLNVTLPDGRTYGNYVEVSAGVESRRAQLKSLFLDSWRRTPH